MSKSDAVLLTGLVTDYCAAGHEYAAEPTYKNYEKLNILAYKLADAAVIAAETDAFVPNATERIADLRAEVARLRELAGEAQRWLVKLHNADLEQDAADAVTVGMVFQKDAMRLASKLANATDDSERARAALRGTKTP